MTTMAELVSTATTQTEYSELLASDKFGIYPAKAYLTIDGSTDDYTPLYNLINTTINGADAEIWFPDGVCLIGTNITIPSNVKLKFLEGGMIKPDTGITITGSGAKIEAGLTQCFDISVGSIAGTWGNNVWYPQWVGAAGDGSTDDTTVIQALIDLAYDIDFGNDIFAVTNLMFDQTAMYYGEGNFLGIASTATESVISITSFRATFQKISVNQNFNTNYTAGVKWYSIDGQNPAQYNKIKAMVIQNSLIGLLFGGESGDSIFDASQSENSITHFHTRGCEVAIYFNQPNGYLLVGESTIQASRNEWETSNPGAYTYADSRAIVIYQGVLHVSNSELLKTDTQLGSGIQVEGGTIQIANCSIEIACQNLDIQDGAVSITNSTAFFSNAATDFIDVASDAVGHLMMNNFEMDKSSGAVNADTAFIKHNGVTTFEFYLSNIRLNNQLRTGPFKGNTSTYYSLPYNCTLTNLYVNDGSASRVSYFIQNNDKENDFLLNNSVDKYADSTDGWYLRDISGTNSFAVAADAPASTKPTPITNCIKLTSGGVSYATTMDITNLTTIKATGLWVRENNVVLCSGWVKIETSGTNDKLVLLTSDSTGASLGQQEIIAEANLSTSWQYFETPVLIGSGVRYVGIGVYGNTSSNMQITGVGMKLLK